MCWFFFQVLNNFWIIHIKFTIWKIRGMYQNSFLWSFPLTRICRCFALYSSYSVMLCCWWEIFWSCLYLMQCPFSPTNVLFPQPLILHRRLLYLLCDTQTDQWPAPGKENHLLWQLHSTGLHHALFWHHQGLCPYSHGLWPLLSYLQASLLHDCHEQDKVQSPHPGSLGWWGCPCLFSVLYDNLFALLWSQWNSPLLLCHFSFIASCLYWYLCH